MGRLAKAWRLLDPRGWCLMASRVGDHLWLLCAENTVMLTGDSLGALLAAVILA
jgi:hypothetical protein